MKNILAKAGAGLLALLALCCTAWGSALSDLGQAAYEAGDTQKAFYYFSQSAQKGEADGQAGLGLLYAKGHGVERNVGTAVELFRKAAAQGSSEGQKDLGMMYAQGRGVRQDYPEAVQWFTKAAKQGNATAQRDLGSLYFQGQGVKQDDRLAFFWDQRASEQGNLQAQQDLAGLYLLGRGTKQDLVEALKWLILARKSHSKKVDAVITEVKKRLSETEIKEAVQRAAAWKPRVELEE